ncbi:Heme exporter protein D (CcmD) [Pseudovibrio axinellae]|uniref:Heme exporter protein D n=1 Tax=Pseudovibrio axinellae TaxID=989403 RepID=A0A166B002_9HYPH|nr:heme exporter protein CcmD [Pseudovibrio axinellae]KZL21768.1 Heme exporter protein D (CcmD) [Pseudovibrio axinellae]SEQ22549.1 heme exporter protein D [Pseudovibrio axinellae]
MDFSEFGRHAEYVVAAYSMAAVVVAGLILWIRSDKSRLEKEMQALEASGIRRRSSRRAATEKNQVNSTSPDEKSGT